MKAFVLFLLFTFCMPQLYSQDLSVPDSILAELKTVQLVNSTNPYDTLSFKIVFPENYKATKNYPVQLCLSGGGQSPKIVDYCYAAWFRSDYFKSYLTILPISKRGENLRHYSKKYILEIINTITKNYKTSNSNWILCGTSNGGAASFNFAAASPKLYEGLIVMPGILNERIALNTDWKHLNVVLAYGEKEDAKWKEKVLESKERLAPVVSKATSIELKGQGHILPIGFAIDRVYRAYFDMNN